MINLTQNLTVNTGHVTSPPIKSPDGTFGTPPKLLLIIFLSRMIPAVTAIDLNSLIRYWLTGSDYDWKTAQGLFKSRRYPYALFMVHLSVEKLLKGLIVKETRTHAPFTHNLVYLAGKLSLDFSKEQIKLLGEMSDFNLEARYPDEQMAFYKKADRSFASHFLREAGKIRTWLKEKF